MSEIVALLRAMRELQQGIGRIAKLLNEAVARDAKIPSNPPKRLVVMKRRIKL